MTVQNRDRDSSEGDSKNGATLAAAVETARLQLLADAIRAQMTQRFHGKTSTKFKLH